MLEKLKCLKSLDYFANPIQLTFKNQSYFQSWLGFFLTVAVMILTIAITITTGNQLFKKEKPTVNQNDGYQYSPDNYTLSSNEIPFTYFYPGDIEKFLDPTYFDVKIYNYVNNRYLDADGNPVFKSSKLTVDYELCKNNPDRYLERYEKLGNFTDELTTDYFYKQHICIIDDDLTIGGNYNSDFFSNILFEVYKCSNTTANNNHCKSNEEMESVALGVNFAVAYIDTIPIPTNYTNPFQRVYTTYYLKLDPNIYMAVDLYFSRVNFTTDTGFMFEDYKYEKAYKFDRFREIYTMTPPNGRVLRLYINISNNVVSITRFYMKIQELVASVGGMLKAGMIVGFAISRFFSKFLFDELLINTFFDYSGIDNATKNIKPLFSNKTLKLVNVTSNKINNLYPEMNKRHISSSKTNVNSEHINSINSNNKNLHTVKDTTETANNLVKQTSDNYLNSNTIDPLTLNNHNNSKKHIKNINKNIIHNDNNHTPHNIRDNYNINNSSNKHNQMYLKYNKQSIKTINEINYKTSRKNINDKYHLDYFDIINMFLCPCRPISKNKKAVHNVFKERLNEYTDYSEVINEVISFRYFKEYIIYNDIEINSEAHNKVKIDFNPYIVKDDPHLKAFIQSFTHLTKEKLINENVIKKMMKLIKKEQKKMN